jgi:hypothetical protein
MPSGDPYDYRAPGFVPNEYNSLRVSENDGRTRGARELRETRDKLLAGLRENPKTNRAFEDSDVIVYDGDLYIVGGYIRRLMESPD